MLQIGCHLSSVKGFEHMGEEAEPVLGYGEGS